MHRCRRCRIAFAAACLLDGILAFAKSAADQRIDISKVEVVTFDFYAALMDTVESLKDGAAPILAADTGSKHMTRADTDEFVISWSSQYSGYVGVANTLQRNPDLEWGEKDLFRMMLNITLENTCAKASLTLQASTKHALIESWKKLRPWRNTSAALRALRAARAADGTPRFRLAALSNADAEFLRAGCAVLEAEAGVTFDAYFGCDGLGAKGVCLFKPEPIFYNQTMSLVEQPGQDWREKVLHVAGAQYDANGAKAFGFRTVWNSNSTRPVFFDYTGTGMNWPDAILHEIGELPSVLGLVGTSEYFL